MVFKVLVAERAPEKIAVVGGGEGGGAEISVTPVLRLSPRLGVPMIKSLKLFPTSSYRGIDGANDASALLIGTFQASRQNFDEIDFQNAI